MKSKNYLKILLFILFGVVVFMSCKDQITDNSKDLVFPGSKVSYSQHVQPLFDYRCDMTTCHDNEPANTRLSLTSYFGLTKYPGIVVPGLPDNSILIQRLDGRLRPRMPLKGDTLIPNHLTGLRTWIKEGALAN
jgi:hypothetical protein